LEVTGSVCPRGRKVPKEKHKDHGDASLGYASRSNQEHARLRRTYIKKRGRKKKVFTGEAGGQKGVFPLGWLGRVIVQGEGLVKRSNILSVRRRG